MADEELKVTIDAENLEPDTVVKTEEPQKKVEAKEPVNDLAEQFKRLEAEKVQDRQRIASAEQRASDERRQREALTRDLAVAKDDIADREAQTIVTALAAAQAASAAAEAEYKTAYEAGDAATMAAANRKLARAESDAGRFEEAKADLEARKKDKPAEPTRVEKPADDFDKYLSQFTPTTSEWLRTHKEWVTDNRKNAKLQAAHHNAIADGLAPDSTEYFDHVETFIGLKTPPEPEKKVEANGAAKKRTSAPVAPVQASGNSMSENEVRLTAGEAKAAVDGTLVWNYDDKSPQKKFKKDDPIGIQEFARRKREGIKQGLYDRSYVES